MKSTSVFGAGALFLAVWLFPGVAAACCNYGCCDCSCIALQAEKNAPAIAKSIERKLKSRGKSGAVQSFTINVAEKPGASAWKCSPSATGAVCTRSQ